MCVYWRWKGRQQLICWEHITCDFVLGKHDPICQLMLTAEAEVLSWLSHLLNRLMASLS